ncbi:hypothetical protein [Archangium primigenium]|uniref:hypothetical protein n=1 Tax=[Archangium] primigenium TaxID=2792470 RepID=UPI001EF8E8B4|nr:hypothetical protein [Archangium primigenium]
MRADFLLWSGVLLIGLTMGACGGDNTGSPGSDAGVILDGGGGDGGVPPGDGGPQEPPVASGCDVAKQTGCGAGETCLRGTLAGGGQGNVCFAAECDVVAQNCAVGSRCTYVTRGDVTARRCVPTGSGTVAEGASCASTATVDGDFYDNCQPGLACTSQETPSGGSTPYTCKRFCYGGEGCRAPQDCVEVVRFTGTNELPRVCGAPGAACDVLAQGCASPLACYPSPQSGNVCVTAGALGAGQTCTYSNDCAPGSACVSEGARFVCRALCRSPSGSPSCASGRCEPLQNASGVGVCVP